MVAGYPSFRRRSLSPILVWACAVVLSAGCLQWSAEAQEGGPTQVSGIISSDTLWITGEGPYIVTGNILVERGVNLILEPGLEVRFDGDYYIKVDGGITAVGNSSNRIVFTSNRADPGPMDWRHIELSPLSDNASCRVEHCVIQYAYNGIYCQGASPTIANNTISYCWNAGIRLEDDANPSVLNNTIRKNGSYGIQSDDGRPYIADNLIVDNRYSGISCGGNIIAATIVDNVISGHEEGIGAATVNPTVSGNVLMNNEYGIHLYQAVSSPSNNTVVNNTVGVLITGDSTINMTGNNLLDNSDYDVRCECDNDVEAPNNYWGTNNTTKIDERIFDYYDDMNYGRVLYRPFLDGPSPHAPGVPSLPGDRDGDGVGDEEDAFPDDPAASDDTDGDGHPDRWNPGMGAGDSTTGLSLDVFPSDPDEWTDTDGDGVGDNTDAFPGDPSEWTDTDGDGVGDNTDAFPGDPSEWMDTDGDGVGDNSDAFPDDPLEWVDTDGDGVGDNTDAFPLDADRWMLEVDGGDGEDGPDYVPVAAGAGAVALTVVLLVGATEAGKAWLLPALFPMFTRLRGKKVLNQFTRGQVYGLIKGNPGIHYTRLLRDLEIGNGTLAYHLSVLEREGFVRSKRNGFNKLFYPTRLPARFEDIEERFPEGEEVPWGAVLSPLQESIVALVGRKPGITQAEIVEALRAPKQTVSYNVKRLVDYGIVEVRIEGNRTGCYVLESGDG